MSTTREEGLAVLRRLVPDLPFDEDGELPTSDSFAAGLLDESLECVFGRVWTRPGLNWRSRSLVTLGVLIALRAEGELRVHFPIALRNGLTRDELEEVVYHAAAYAGFPAASTAGRIGQEVLDQ
ncbi:carboxymuconolactone decarboxylase family protein [Mycobacterium sp.]|uniref:carboxymuconolactone decarboxylase family protein n=1 Tax=Mycobacterium sp. TaxID=1785 RepID=UPI003C771207